MNLRHLSIRLLQVFVEVVEQRSVTAAARKLHLTQPTVSLQLKKLADVVGEPLFEPHGTNMQLTGSGQVVYDAALDILGRLTELSDTLQQHQTGSAGQLNIAVVTTAKYLLPKLLARYRKQFPFVQISLHIANRAEILRRFEQGLDDLYIFSHPPAGDWVRALRFLKNPLLLIAPTDHWACGQTIQFEQLIGETFLIREPGSATRWMFETWLSRYGYQLHHVLQIESNEVIRMSVQSGLGIAVLSAHSLQEQEPNIKPLSVQNFQLESHWYLVRHKDRRLSATTREFILLLQHHISEVAASELHHVEFVESLAQWLHE